MNRPYAVRPQHHRTSEGHVAVEFRDLPVHVYLDDAEISDACVEANAEEGWVIIHRFVGAGWERERKHGQVRIEGWIDRCECGKQRWGSHTQTQLYCRDCCPSPFDIADAMTRHLQT